MTKHYLGTTPAGQAAARVRNYDDYSGIKRMFADANRRKANVQQMKAIPMPERFTLYVRSNMRGVHKYGIKNILQRWINEYRDTDEKDAAVEAVRDWIHVNRHLFTSREATQ